MNNRYSNITTENNRTQSYEKDPPLEVDPNFADGMKLLMAINQTQQDKISPESTQSIKDLIKQVELMKKERELHSNR